MLCGHTDETAQFVGDHRTFKTVVLRAYGQKCMEDLFLNTFAYL